MIENTGLLRTRIFLILIAMIFFISCHKDDDAVDHSQHGHGINSSVTFSSVSPNDIPQIMDYLSVNSNDRGQFIISKSENGTRLNEDDLVIGELQTREIIQVTNQYNRSNYTFLLTSIESSNSTINSVFNLVVKESSNGLFSYITEYRPNSDWIPNYRDTQDFSTFSGEILHYNIDGSYMAKLTLDNGVALSGQTRNPCPPDGDSNNDTGNNGGNEGNTDGNTEGGDTGDGTPGGEDNTPGPEVEAALMWLCNHRNQLHNTPSECNNPAAGGTWVVVITYGDKSVEDTLRCPDLPDLPEECYQPNTEPCPYGCNSDGTCADTPPNNEDNESNETIGVNYEFPNAAALDEALEDNPFLLIEIDCDQLPFWQELAQHTAPESIQDKIANLPHNTFNNFQIQSLEDARGTIVNMDFFSVNITSLPNNPNTGQQFTPDEFLDHFRRNINDFVEGSTFEPYCEISSICQQETNLWNSNNPLGALVYIDIPVDDGVVILTEFTNSYWHFMTMNAPIAGNHPVSGTRQFGYETNADGSISLFVRGVDRFGSNAIENLAFIRGLGNPFFGADNLWESFQEKTNQFVNNNGGTASIVSPVTNRPDWDKMEEVLRNERPITDYEGCN